MMLKRFLYFLDLFNFAPIPLSNKMKTRLLILFFVMASAVALRAQLTMHKMVHAGYIYQNQSFGEIGARLLFLKHDDVAYRLGGAAVMGSVNGKFAVMPKVQGDILLNFERNVDFYHSYYFLAGAEVTSKYIAPKIGATLFGMLDVTGGYALPIGKGQIHGKQLKGLNIGVTLSIPIVLISELAE